MTLTREEQLACLTDRPCTVCKFHSDEGCEKWRCVFEEEPEEQDPKQVELEGDGYADGELVYDYGKCPTCGWQFEEGDKDWEEPFCCHCGQKLTWFEKGDKE